VASVKYASLRDVGDRVADGLGAFVRGRTLWLRPPVVSAERRRLNRVKAVWCLLFFDVLGAGPTKLLPLPHKFGQALTQGALGVALLLALSVNPKIRARPNLFLILYSILGVTTLIASMRALTVGDDYRAFRFLAFLATLWLLTPWWGRRDLVLLKAQMRFLVWILASVAVGFVLSHGSAMAGGRLQDAFWPIPPPQVAHYSAELAGLALVLWLCGLMRRWLALLIAIPAFAVLIMTHTRTALVAAVAGFLVAGLSLFTASRRVRRAFTTLILLIAIVGLPSSPIIVHWLTRGENSDQLTTLTGRTNFWSFVFSAPRPETNVILGDGLSNGAINDPSNPAVQGLPIDSSWVEDYQDQGLIGDVLTGLMFMVLLLTAAFRPRGPTRALALFLIVYCLIASFTEDGAGIASQYALDLTVAASLLAITSTRVSFHRGRESPAL
jgi:hypothetical protein